jgi:hypothetical protein
MTTITACSPTALSSAKANAAPVGRLSNILQCEPVVAGGRFRARTRSRDAGVRRTPPIARQLERGRFNRFLAMLPPHDFALLRPHLRTVTLERGVMLHEAAGEIERVYFPHGGMVSLVAVMQSGATVETATIGRAGVIGASTGFGAKQSVGRAIVQLPGTPAWLSALYAAANQSQAIRHLIVRYNDLLLAEVQQSVACNALHLLEARLCRELSKVRVVAAARLT